MLDGCLQALCADASPEVRKSAASLLAEGEAGEEKDLALKPFLLVGEVHFPFLSAFGSSYCHASKVCH